MASHLTGGSIHGNLVDKKIVYKAYRIDRTQRNITILKKDNYVQIFYVIQKKKLIVSISEIE